MHLLQPRGVRQPARSPRGEGRIRHARRAEREAEEASDGRELSSDRRRRQLPRPCAAELGGVVGEHAHIDVLEVDAPLSEPLTELRDVDRIGRPSRVRQGRGGEEPIDRLRDIHETVLRSPVSIASPWTIGSSHSRA
jgi:hypothetical protein